MQSFQSQLNILQEKSAKHQVELTTQNENLQKEIVRLKTNEDVDLKVLQEISKISNKLGEVTVIANESNGKTVLSTSSKLEATSSQRSKFAFLKDIALWGTALSALYYIIKVD